MQLGQVFGLFFLPGGRPRPRRDSGSLQVSVFGIMTASGRDSGSGSTGVGTVVVDSGICVTGAETGGSEG